MIPDLINWKNDIQVIKKPKVKYNETLKANIQYNYDLIYFNYCK